MAIADCKTSRTYFTNETDRVVVTYRSDKTPDGLQARAEIRNVMQALLDQPLLQCANHPQGFETLHIDRHEERWVVKIAAIVPKLRSPQ